MELIIDSIKTMLGIEKDITNFDQEILMHINAHILSISQLGIGPKNGLMISPTTTWIEYLGDRQDLEASKTLLYLKVRLSFDPPSNSFLTESYQRTIDELSWRLLLQTGVIV